MSETRTIAEWEMINKKFFYSDENGKRKVTKDEFSEMTKDPMSTIDCSDGARETWLKENGYELTRENFINHELPTVQKGSNDDNEQ